MGDCVFVDSKHGSHQVIYNAANLMVLGNRNAAENCPELPDKNIFCGV